MVSVVELHLDHRVQEAVVDEHQPGGHWTALRSALKLNFTYSFNSLSWQLNLACGNKSGLQVLDRIENAGRSHLTFSDMVWRCKQHLQVHST